MGVSIAMTVYVTWDFGIDCQVRKKWMAQTDQGSQNSQRSLGCLGSVGITTGYKFLQEWPAQKSLQLAISVPVLNPEKIGSLLLRNQCIIPLHKDG